MIRTALSVLLVSFAFLNSVAAGSETAVAVTVDVKAGSASADVSTAALDANGGKVQVTIDNNTEVAWHDVWVEFIKKAAVDPGTPSIGTATLDNPTGGSHTATDSAPADVSGGQIAEFPAGTTQHDFGPKYTGGSETLTCLFEDCNGAENSVNVVRVTPSVLVANEESNLFGTYDLSPRTDLIRKANPATWHGQVIGRVVNRSARATLTRLDGAMTLPASISLDGVSKTTRCSSLRI